MGKNILIPHHLVVTIIELLEYWDISKFDRAIQDDYNDVLRELNLKMKKLELREAYTGIIRANNEDARHSARIDYLLQKNHIALECVGDYE
jgi:hypothetical protein